MVEGREKEEQGRAGLFFFFRKLLFSIKMYFAIVKSKKFPQTSVAAHLPGGRRIVKAMGTRRADWKGHQDWQGC